MGPGSGDGDGDMPSVVTICDDNATGIVLN
jgi:hypothetical protein